MSEASACAPDLDWFEAAAQRHLSQCRMFRPPRIPGEPRMIKICQVVKTTKLQKKTNLQVLPFNKILPKHMTSRAPDGRNLTLIDIEGEGQDWRLGSPTK